MNGNLPRLWQIKYFNKLLLEEECKYLMKVNPIPACSVLKTPKMDDQVKDQLSKDVCCGMEKSLYRIQSSVFDVTGPLTGLWADLLKDERPNPRDVFR